MVTHTYFASATYPVTLTVRDANGAEASSDTTATITTGNLPPLADAGNTVKRKAGRVITFDGTGSGDPDGTIADFAWNFGDGNTGNGRTTTHVYDDAGTYLVTLTVTDDEGTSTSDSTLAEVESSDSDDDGFFGCSIGRGRNDDPTLLLMALVAVVYIARKRLGRHS